MARRFPGTGPPEDLLFRRAAVFQVLRRACWRVVPEVVSRFRGVDDADVVRRVPRRRPARHTGHLGVQQPPVPLPGEISRSASGYSLAPATGCGPAAPSQPCADASFSPCMRNASMNPSACSPACSHGVSVGSTSPIRRALEELVQTAFAGSSTTPCTCSSQLARKVPPGGRVPPTVHRPVAMQDDLPTPRWPPSGGGCSGAFPARDRVGQRLVVVNRGKVALEVLFPAGSGRRCSRWRSLEDHGFLLGEVQLRDVAECGDSLSESDAVARLLDDESRLAEGVSCGRSMRRDIARSRSASWSTL